MSPEKLSSLISLIVAIVILLASLFQWYDVAWNGQHDRLLGRPTTIQKAIGIARQAGSELIAWIHRRGDS